LRAYCDKLLAAAIHDWSLAPAINGPRQMSDEGLGKGRMEAISDGVFAVAMTLMLADVVTAEGAEDWRKNWADKTALFLVTFGISSTYWIAHNNECRYVRKTDRLVLWFNLLFVAAVAFVPASVSMIGHSDCSNRKILTEIYLSNLILMGVFLELWFVSLWRKEFLTPEGFRQRCSTAYRNAVLPLAFCALLIAVFARDANWWPLNHIRSVLLVPLASYVLMTLCLQSCKPECRHIVFNALLAFLLLGVFFCSVFLLVYRNLWPEFVIAAFWLILLVLMVKFFVVAPQAHGQST
jgi:uncharacterized membrane protein